MFGRLVIYITAICFVLLQVSGDTRVAVAHLNTENITGSITFTEVEDGVHVTGEITGLPTGRYGFHVHELGDVSDCDATGAHFNPDSTNHGGREHDVRHVGDLGNVEFVGNETVVARLDFVDSVLSLRGRNSILGRGLVLHAEEDDLGQGGDNASLTTGNAGPRVACAVIGIKSPAEPWNAAYVSLPSTLMSLLLVFISLRLIN